MAENAKGLYYGPGNRGYATILGTQAPSLFDVMDSLKADRDAEEALKREEEKAKTAELNEWLEYNPDKIWEPYGDHQQKMYNVYVDEAAKVYGKGGIVSAEDKSKLAKMQGEIKNVTNRMNSLNEARKKSLDILKDKDSTVDKEKFSRHIGRYHLDIDNGLIAPEEMGSEGLMAPLSDYNYYDQEKVTAKILKHAGEQIDADIDTSPFGYRVEETKTYQKGFKYLYDKNGVKLDDNGQKMFEVTPELVNLYIGDEEGAMMVQKIKDQHKELGETITNEEAVKELVSPQAYYKEKKQAENDSMELQQQRQRSKGKTEDGRLDLFYQDLDTHFRKPTQDEIADLVYIDENGEINEDANGNPLIPVMGPLKGVKIGEKGKDAITIVQQYHDPTTNSFYYKNSDGEFTKYDQESIGNEIKNIAVFDKASRYIDYGRKNGYLGTQKDGTFIFSSKIKESDAIKNSNKQIKEQSERITKGIKQYKDVINTTLEKRETASGNFFGYGFSEEELDSMNNLLSSLPAGTTFELKNDFGEIQNSFTNPEITVETSSFFETKDNFTFRVNGEDTGIKADKEGFKKLMGGIKPTRSIGTVEQETQENTSADTGGAY